MSEVLVVDDLEFEIRRSARRKTLGMTVDRAGELVVHAPEATGRDELRKWVERKLLWVHQKLLLKEPFRDGNRCLEMVSGETITYLGQNYRLKIVGNQTAPLHFDGQWFRLRKRDQKNAARHFQRWYQENGTDWIRKRVETWEPRAGASPARIDVRDLGYRWGSCGKNGVLHFNWRLLQLPVRLIDYVIAHELVHLRERSHGPEFWRILGRVLPDWKERKEELGQRNAEMTWCANPATG